MSIRGGIRARPLVPRTPVLARVLSNTPNVHSRRHTSHVTSSQGHPFSCAYFKHSKCPLGGNRTSPSQGHPCSRAYFKHSKCPSGGTRTSPRPKDTRSRARTSNTPNVHSGGKSHVSASQGHPFSCAYFKQSKCPFVAAPRTSTRSKDTRSRARTQTLQVSIPGGKRARPLVPRRPVLVREFQTC